MSEGLIADIQRSSIHDGPGIRTTIFFKGCPLKCKWCHNPECISFEKQIMYYPEKCIKCGKCDEGCYSGAKIVCGQEFTAHELLKEILIDKDYFKINGGVTFSGGEPLAQPEFLNEMLDLCKENGIHCALETSLIYFDEKILSKLDLIIADLKIWNSDTHKEYTGVPNDVIKSNFIKLNKLNIPIIARTPVISEINQEIDKISDFLKQLENVIQYELLPYHQLGISKGRSLGVEIERYEELGKDYMEGLKKYAYIRR